MSIEPSRPLPASLMSWIESAPADGARSHKVDAFVHVGDDERRERSIFQLQARQELTHLRTLLDGPLILLKGLEVAQLYPEPWQRGFIDIDLLCPATDEADHQLRQSGYNAVLGLETLPDYHQTAALARPDSPVTVELHRRPHWAAWSTFPTDELIATAQPSRTEIADLLRPSDDFHAVILAWHFWRDGAHRCRDLIDLSLLRNHTTDATIQRTAVAVGMAPMWRRTRSLLDGLAGRRSLNRVEQRLVRLDPVSHSQRRLRQWAGIGLGGLGARSELTERLMRRGQRRRTGAPL